MYKKILVFKGWKQHNKKKATLQIISTPLQSRTQIYWGKKPHFSVRSNHLVMSTFIKVTDIVVCCRWIGASCCFKDSVSSLPSFLQHHITAEASSLTLKILLEVGTGAKMCPFWPWAISVWGLLRKLQFFSKGINWSKTTEKICFLPASWASWTISSGGRPLTRSYLASFRSFYSMLRQHWP